VFSFMQSLGYLCRFLWARQWTNGQNRGQDQGCNLSKTYLIVTCN
jgi:hypothetical protein